MLKFSPAWLLIPKLRDHISDTNHVFIWEQLAWKMCSPFLYLGREGTSAGALDEEDFIRAFEDVPTMQVRQPHNKQSPRAVLCNSTRTDNILVSILICYEWASSKWCVFPPTQIYSNREMEDSMTKVREVLSDDKRDWEHRVAAVRSPDTALLTPTSSHSSHWRFIKAHQSADWNALLIGWLVGWSMTFDLSSLVEEDAFSAPGWSGGVWRLLPAAEANGGGIQTVSQRPALTGGTRGLHHPGVRKSTSN